MTMERFIAESRIRDPKRMVRYIQYFIWYQMITGLIQTTAVSVYALFFVPDTELSYVIWLMLINSTTQYPGFLGVFSGALSSLQYFNKKAVLDFVNGAVFQLITEVGFILIGKWIGSRTPVIGELFGIAMGAAVGKYIDDFFAMMLSARFFSKALEKEGITWRMCFEWDFDWPMVKECLSFGIKTGLPSIIGVFIELMILVLYLDNVAQYTTFIALSEIGRAIGSTVNVGSMNLTTLISEAYLNGKKKLTQYYIGQYWRFVGILQFFMMNFILMLYLVLPIFFEEMGLDNYLLSIPFIIPGLIRDFQQPYTSLADQLLSGSNKPNFLILIRLCEELLKLLFMTMWLVWLQLPVKFGYSAIIWIMPCGIYPAILFKTIVLYVYTHKKIVPLKILGYSTFIAPALSTTFIIGFSLLVRQFLFFPVLEAWGYIPAFVIYLGILVPASALLYFPISTLLGAWDDSMVNDFRKAALMSGPSKFLVMPLYKSVARATKYSKLHNKFHLDTEGPLAEAEDLFRQKMANRAAHIEEIQKST